MERCGHVTPMKKPRRSGAFRYRNYLSARRRGRLQGRAARRRIDHRIARRVCRAVGACRSTAGAVAGTCRRARCATRRSPGSRRSAHGAAGCRATSCRAACCAGLCEGVAAGERKGRCQSQCREFHDCSLLVCQAQQSRQRCVPAGRSQFVAFRANFFKQPRSTSCRSKELSSVAKRYCFPHSN